MHSNIGNTGEQPLFPGVREEEIAALGSPTQRRRGPLLRLDGRGRPSLDEQKRRLKPS